MAYKAQQTTLQYGDAATPEKFAALGLITSISGPSFSNPTVDASDLDDTIRDKISSGLCDSGQVTLNVNFDARTANTQDTVFIDRIIAGTAAGNFAINWSNVAQTTTQLTVSSVDTVANDVTTSVSHGLHTGQPIRIASSTTVPAGLVAATTYYAIYVDADELSFALTNALAVAGTAIDITGEGEGTITITKGSKAIFPAVVTDAAPTANLGEALTGTITLDVTGAVTLTQ